MTWIHDQIYAAGGNHIPSTWDSFADQTGISAVLHINPDSPERFTGCLPVQFLWVNVAEESQAELNERILAADYLQTCISAGLCVLLHSSLGLHRTRWAYVAYSIAAGRSVKTVLRTAAEPPWLAPYNTDREAWEEFAAVCRGKSAVR
jgi:hypothetical protein